MVSITVRNLTKRFGTVTALDNVSLRIEAGDLYFLLGPSGCGKTTLLRHIAGFYMPDHGQILFDDKDVSQKPPHLRNTAMMFQSYALWPHMTVGRNVAFGLEERKVPRSEIEERVLEALALVKMEDYLHRKINQLSGGQQQRVALARSLVVRPRCLLLDEPLSNLDAKLRIEMRAEIRRICKEFGLTGIYVTHDQKEALSMADRMAILDDGKIIQTGSPQDIYGSPRSKVVAEFIGETNFIPGTVETTPDDDGEVTVKTGHGVFTGRPTDPAWKPKKGASATLSIRPEALRFVRSGNRDNVFSGTLGMSLYLGELAQYELRTAAGPSLVISELNPRELRESNDDTVHLEVDSGDVVVLSH